MSERLERDAMICRACGKEERASEGYPCEGCGRFVCNICTLRGITRCRECQARAAAASPPSAPPRAPGA